MKSISEPQTYLWYDVKKDKLIEWPGCIAYVAMVLARGEKLPPEIAKVEMSEDFLSGRLIGVDGSICEYIGEV